MGEFFAVEDGHVFLTPQELDDYRTQQVERQIEEGQG